MRSTLPVAVGLISLAGPAGAQDEPVPPATAQPAQGSETRSAEELIEEARDALRPGGGRRVAGPPAGPGDIVVTANIPEPMVDLYPDDPADADNGRPRAPDMFNLPPHVGVVWTVRGCFLQACPRPLPPLIDLKAIPEAPPGSDAARYAEE